MKIRPLGAELFHVGGRTDRRTDMTKLIVALSNFAKSAQKSLNKFIIFFLAVTATDDQLVKILHLS